MPELGDGALDRPFEDAPPVFVDMSDDGEVASGVVLMAAVIDVPEFGPKPALVFQFARGDGTSYPPRILIAEPRQIQALKPLTRAAVDAAVQAAHRAGGR